MKFSDILKSINFFMQIFWVLAIVLNLLTMGLGRDGSMYFLYIALFMGANHVLVSFLAMLFSKHRYRFAVHFLLSILVITTFSSLTRGWSEDLVWVAPALLAVYFWYLSFTWLNPFRRHTHNVFDL